VQTDPNIVVREVKSPGFQGLVMMTTEKPFNDNRVRLAVKHLIDRDALVQAVWQGRATPSTDQPVPSISQFYSQVESVAYDPAKARSLLAEAGYPNGFDLELYTSNERVGLQELAVAAQQMLAAANIRVQIKTLPWSVYTDTAYGKRQFFCENTFGRATIDESIFTFFHSKGPWNSGRYNNPALDQLLDRGRSQVDLAQRKETYAAAQKLINDDGSMVIPYHQHYVAAMSKTVLDQAVHPLRYWDFRRTHLA
jgi:peptide/nickel transport system substrate-binding protein